MYAIGVDSGTQGTKVLIVDFGGKILSRGYSKHRFVPGLKPGESEQEPGIWITALLKALKEALEKSKIDPSKVVSIGVSGQQHGFVALNKEGIPIRPAKLWNDVSTTKETEEIIKKMGGRKKFIKKMGINLAVGFTASKILWLKKKEPKNYNKLSTILLPHNYINYYLTGNKSMEYGDASGTGLMNIIKRKWSREAIGTIDPEIEEKLPGLHHPSEPVGYVKPGLAKKFNLQKVLVSSGGGDNMMAAIGTGNVIPGVVTLSLGTSGTVYSYFSVPFVDPVGEIASFCDSTGGWLPLLCTMNVTNVTEYLKDMFGFSNENLDNCASKASPGSNGLIFLPFISGERVPVLPDSNGVFFGLNSSNFNQYCISRSILEGTIFNLGYGFNRMKTLNLIPDKIRATGGGSNSKLWLKIIATIFETPVATLEEQEAGAFGAAIQSIWTYNNITGNKITIEEIAEEMVKEHKEITKPDIGSVSLYRDLQERFNSLWKTLKPEFTIHKTLLP